MLTATHHLILDFVEIVANAPNLPFLGVDIIVQVFKQPIQVAHCLVHLIGCTVD